MNMKKIIVMTIKIKGADGPPIVSELNAETFGSHSAIIALLIVDPTSEITVKSGSSEVSYKFK